MGKLCSSPQCLISAERDRQTIDRLRLELSEKRAVTRQSSKERARDERYQEFIGRVYARFQRGLKIPTWLSSPKRGTHIVVPTAVLSDMHFDESIDPAQINNVNAYSREIAIQRLKIFFENTIKLGKEHFAGLTYPGIVLALGGDCFSGNIHEELRQTNEGYLCESILYYIRPMVAGIKMLADAYGHVFIPGVVGNHGRQTHKPIHKGRVRDNVDWVFYQLLSMFLEDDRRITFAISESSDITYTVLQTRFCLTHGDQFRGGSGIAGLLSPLMIGDARKRKRAVAINRPYDYMVMGHWHTLVSARGIVVNGSLKGYDEYASDSNFDFEPPQQAFFLTSAERRQIWGFTPVHCTKKDDPYSGAWRDSHEKSLRAY